MKIGSFMTVLVAAGLVATPVAAQAGTKASAAVVTAADYGSRAAPAVAAKNKFRMPGGALGGVGFFVAALGLYFAVKSDGDDSRG